ncbi:MAG: sulfatase [Planctomycetota bacterium]
MTTYRGEQRLSHLERTVAARDFSFGAAWVDVALAVPEAAERLVIETLPTTVSGHRESLALYLIDPVLVPQAGASELPNVVLISIDTLRRDHLACYGYARPTSPNLDAFAAQGALFDSCIAQCSYTLPSHVSMLSGQYPMVHGVRVVDDHIVAGKTPLLGEILHAAGYRTAGFAGGLLVHSSYGYERGFDAYADRDPLMNAQGEQAIARYLEQSVNAPFFLFVHTYGVHDFFASEDSIARFHPGPCASKLHGKPYLDWGVVSVENGYGEADRRHLVDLYDAAIANTDGFVGAILSKLRGLGLDDRTLVIITADHGKELLDRGTLAHGHTLYDEMIRVPLMMRGPGIAPQRLGALVELVDITPTVVDLVKLAAQEGMQGTSLLPLMHGATEEKLDALSELVAATHKLVWRSKVEKLIESTPRDGESGVPEVELYDLLLDPGERHALPAASERGHRLGDQLHRACELLARRAQELGSRTEKTTIDEDLEDLLRQQGYLGKDRGPARRK